MKKDITIEEANRALNELEVRTIFLGETDGYDYRRLTVIYKPARISCPITYEVHLKHRQSNETDKITEREFVNLPEAVRFYNDMR